MIKQLLFLLSALLFTTSVFSGVDVKLKLHYNNYPLCNWEVKLKHNDALVATGVTNLKGVVEYKDIVLFNKGVDVFLYKLPKVDNRWNAQAFIELNNRYEGELDFGPIVASGDAPKAALEEAWGITLYDCENLTSADILTVDETKDYSEEPGKAGLEAKKDDIKAKRDNIDDIEVGLESMVESHHQRRIDSLNVELGIIEENKSKLIDAGPPDDEVELKIYKAMLDELEKQRKWTDTKLRMVNTIAHGDDASILRANIKAYRERYYNAREHRLELQHEARKVAVERKDEVSPGSTPFDRRLKKIQTDIALNKEALRNEQESENPDAERIAELKSAIAALERKLDDLVE